MKKKWWSFLTTLIPQLISNPLLAFLYSRNVSERRRPLTYHQFNHMAFSLYSPAFSPDILIREPVPIPNACLANTPLSLYSSYSAC